MQRWPTWSKFIRLCLSIQSFFSSPISAVIRLLIQPSFLSFTSCINSDCALPTNCWSLHIFLLLSQRGGKWSCTSISHVLCIFYLMWTLCYSPEQEQAQPDDGERATEGLSQPSFNPLNSLTLWLKLHFCTEYTRNNARFTWFTKSAFLFWPDLSNIF